MKILLSSVLSGVVIASVSTTAFAQCSHNYDAADLSDLKIATTKTEPQAAMSTYDPAGNDVLLEVKEPVVKIEKSE